MNIVSPPTQIERDQIEEILAIVQTPYKILRCADYSSIVSIRNKYIELSISNRGNQEYINKLCAAFKLLSNERLRFIYDKIYNSEKETITPKTLISTLITPICHNLTRIILSPTSSGDLFTIALDLYNKLDIEGFYKGAFSRVVIQWISRLIKGMLGVPSRDVFLSIGCGDGFSIKNFKGYWFYGFDFLIYLIKIAPVEMASSQIIDTFILKKTISSQDSSLSSNNFKNILLSIGYGAVIYYMDVYFRYYYSKLRVYLLENSKTNDLTHYGNLILNNRFCNFMIEASVRLPLHLIQAQYPSVLLTDSLQIPLALNPVSMAIKLFNSQHSISSIRRLVYSFQLYSIEKALS